MARKRTKDYAQSDLETLWRRGEWHDYKSVVNWLETEGNNDNELTPGEVEAMDADIKRIMNEGKPFSRDPDEVFDMAHEGRNARARKR